MGYDLTVQGLIRKRAELAGQVEELHAKLGALMAALAHIDGALHVLKPDIALELLPEKLPPSPFSGFRGEIQRFLLDALRQADGPMSTFDLTRAVMAKRGMDPDDKVVFRMIARRTGYALAKLRRKGAVQSRRLGGNNGVMEWWHSNRHSGPLLLARGAVDSTP